LTQAKKTHFLGYRSGKKQVGYVMKPLGCGRQSSNGKVGGRIKGFPESKRKKGAKGRGQRMCKTGMKGSESGTTFQNGIKIKKKARIESKRSDQKKNKGRAMDQVKKNTQRARWGEQENGKKFCEPSLRREKKDAKGGGMPSTRKGGHSDKKKGREKKNAARPKAQGRNTKKRQKRTDRNFSERGKRKKKQRHRPIRKEKNICKMIKFHHRKKRKQPKPIRRTE